MVSKINNSVQNDDLMPARLLLKAMDKYGSGNGAIICGVLEAMKPFDSENFSEEKFWNLLEESMERIESHRKIYGYE